MNGIIGFVLAVLIYPGVLVAAVAALALAWVRLAARGALGGGHGTPPGRLLGELRAGYSRETFAPEGVAPLVLTLTTYAALLFPLVALVLLPVPGNPLVSALGLRGDLVAEVGLLVGLPLARLLVGWAVPSPYTRLASDRSARLLAGAIVPLVFALTASAQLSGTLLLERSTRTNPDALHVIGFILAAAACACALPVLARLTPVHADDGEGDVAGGELAELSGRDLTFFRAGEAIQLVAVAGLFVSVFVLPVLPITGLWGRGIAWAVALVLTAAGIGAWEGIRGTRPEATERPPLTWWLGLPTLLGLAALVVAAWATRA